MRGLLWGLSGPMLASMTVSLAGVAAAQPAEGPFRDCAVDGWRLGLQAYTFRNLSLLETIDKARELGIRDLEAYPGQLVKPGLEERFTVTASDWVRAAVVEKLHETGVRLSLFGVVDLGPNEGSARQVFDFAKALHIDTLTAEPNPALMPLIDRLCDEYDMRLAIHNHPAPSPYAEPQKVLDAVQDLSPRVGACADVGHWFRTGVTPVDGLRLLENRIVSLHFKDVQRAGNHTPDVIWGTGECDAEALLQELHRQGFQGVFSIEHETEYDTVDELTEAVRACVDWFHEQCAKLAGDAAEA